MQQFLKHVFASTLTLGVALAQPAVGYAQTSSFAPMTWYQNGIMRQQTLNGWKAREKARNAQEEGGAAKPAQVPTQILGAANFKPVAPDLLPAVLAQQQASNADELRALERYYRINLDYMERGFKQINVPIKDLGVALAAYLMINYAVALDMKLPILSTEQNRAFIKNLREAVMRDAQIQALDNRSRQLLYEELLLTGLSLQDALDLSKQNNKPEAGKQARALARKNVEEFMGVPIARVKITPSGIEPQ
jgi:hypothetical protein